jgi:hypothetical protein
MESSIGDWTSCAYTTPLGPTRRARRTVNHVGDHRPLADAERVHDQVGLLPGVTVRPFEDAEFLGREEPSRPFLRGAAGPGDGQQRHHGKQRGAPRHRSPPATPGSVIAAGARTRSS